MEYKNKIKTILMNLGIDPALNGFAYLVEAVEITIDDKKNKKIRPTTKLYRDIAYNMDSSSSKVERAMRNAIEKCFLKGTPMVYKMFGSFISEYSGKVTVSTFVAVIAEKIIMNEN